VNPALNLVYSSASFTYGGTLTAIDGQALSVITTLSNLNGVSVDMSNDQFWSANLSGGDVLTYAGATNSQVGNTSTGYLPATIAVDANRRQVWVGAQGGGGNDPLFLFNADTNAQIAGPIGSGGVMTQIVVNPATGKLYFYPSGTSSEVNPTTYAVTATGFGYVQAVDDVQNLLFATGTNALQVINGATDTIKSSTSLSYTPAAMAVNKALKHVYLTNTNGTTVEIRSEGGTLLGSYSLGQGNQPNAIAADSIRGRIYVEVYKASSGASSIWVLEDLTGARSVLSPGGP
jgi:DNA-binding beta-propeller fold protein YncE